MGTISYHEISWEDLKSTETVKKLTSLELVGWLMALGIVISIVVFSVPFRRMVLTDEEIYERYSRQYEWLNRCDEACAGRVNTHTLNSQIHCSALEEWYNADRRNYVQDWRIAIDDRAASIGCPGFPKEMSEIVEGAKEISRRMQAEENKVRAEKQKAFKQQDELQSERYVRSLLEGGLRRYISKAQQYQNDKDTMVLTMSQTWFLQPERLQSQIAQVFWQKWVNIRNPSRPNIPRIRMITPDGIVVGGSPAGAAYPIEYQGITEAEYQRIDKEYWSNPNHKEADEETVVYKQEESATSSSAVSAVQTASASSAEQE